MIEPQTKPGENFCLFSHWKPRISDTYIINQVNIQAHDISTGRDLNNQQTTKLPTTTVQFLCFLATLNKLWTSQYLGEKSPSSLKQRKILFRLYAHFDLKNASLQVANQLLHKFAPQAFTIFGRQEDKPSLQKQHLILTSKVEVLLKRASEITSSVTQDY